MYVSLLKQIAAEMSRQKLQPACSAHDIIGLTKRSKHKLGHDIPAGYAHFLGITNGLLWNGLSIYASETTPLNGLPDVSVMGFVEANSDYRKVREDDPMHDYLIFAEDSTAFFTYHIPDDDYKVILIVGMTVIESFKSFNELLRDAIKGHV
jgi:hypothetical protein